MERESRTARRTAGFTLMEIMIVIVILSILAALVLPNYLGSMDKGNVAAAKGQIAAFKTALFNYKLKFNKFPTSGEGLDALVNNSTERFLDADNIPKDPWGNPYVYTCPGTRGHDYEIVSYGRDGQPGGTNYDADIESWNLQGTGQGK